MKKSLSLGPASPTRTVQVVYNLLIIGGTINAIAWRVVVDAVWNEFVSPSSLFIRVDTGEISAFVPGATVSLQRTVVYFGFWIKFPDIQNREFRKRIREHFRFNRDTLCYLDIRRSNLRVASYSF